MLRLIQPILLWLYGTRISQWIIRSPVGGRVFEWAYLFYKRHLEAREWSVLVRQVDPDRWVVDVGANIGFYSTLFLDRIGDQAKVVAIEPESVNFQKLQRRIDANAHFARKAILVNAAAGSRVGECELRVNTLHPGDHQVATTEGNGPVVPLVTIDALVAEHGGVDVGFIKIDTQGFEYEVLRGAGETIKRCRPKIFLEFDPQGLGAFGVGSGTLLDFFFENDYSIRHLDAGDFKEITRSEIDALVESMSYTDFLCTPRGVRAGER